MRVSRDYARASEQAEAQARLSSVQRALAQLTELVIVLDRRGAVAMAAGPVELMLGRKPSELVGQPGRGPALHGAAHAGARSPAERVRVRNARTGEERMCETRAFPLHEADRARRRRRAHCATSASSCVTTRSCGAPTAS